MLASWASFNELVHEYGLARVEGVLLRYLSGCWRTLSKTVPEAVKTDDVVEIEHPTWIGVCIPWRRSLPASTDQQYPSK